MREGGMEREREEREAMPGVRTRWVKVGEG